MYNPVYGESGFERAKDYVEDYFKGYNPAKTPEENKAEFLMRHIPGLSSEKAGEDAEAIRFGCEVYSINVKNRLNGEKYTLKNFFEEQLSELSIEEKYKCAEKVLSLVYAADALTVYEYSGEDCEEIKEKLRGELSGESAVEDGSIGKEELDKLLDELDDALNSTVAGFAGADKLLEETEKNGTAAFVSPESIGEASQLKEITALANYIICCNRGEEEPELKKSPEEIAVITSGAIDRHNAIICAAAGGAPWEDIKSVLIAIGGGVIMLLTAFAALSLMVLCAESGLILAEVIFAESIIAAVLGLLGGIGVWGLAITGVLSILGKYADDIEIIADKAAEKTAKVLYKIGEYIKKEAKRIFGRKPAGAACLSIKAPVILGSDK